MVTTGGAVSGGGDVLHWLRYGHAETAAVVASVQLGLLDLLAEEPGLRQDEIARRCGLAPPAARALAQVLLRARALRTTSPAGAAGGPATWSRAGLRLSAEVTGPVRQQLAAAADLVRERWPALVATEAWRTGTWHSGTWHTGSGGPAPDLTDLTPAPIRDGAGWLRDRCRHGYLRCRVLTVASELGVLTAVRDAPATAAVVAAATGTPPSTAAWLLAALAQLGACVRAGPAYHLAPALVPVLAPGRGSAAFRLAAELSHEFWPALGGLPAVARSGQLGLDLQHADTASRYYRRLARYNSLVFPQYFRLARAVAEALTDQLADRAAPLVCDVGAGSGVWGTAFARAWPRATVTFLDRAAVLAQTRTNANRLGIAGRSRFRDIDLSVDRLGPDHAADVLVLGQICHTQPAASLPDLLARCARALRPGGVLVLADVAPDPVSLEPAAYVAFAIKELVATGGSILDLTEYRELLSGAGFRTQQCHRFPGLEVFLASGDPSTRLPAEVRGGTAAYRPEVVA